MITFKAHLYIDAGSDHTRHISTDDRTRVSRYYFVHLTGNILKVLMILKGKLLFQCVP